MYKVEEKKSFDKKHDCMNCACGNCYNERILNGTHEEYAEKLKERTDAVSRSIKSDFNQGVNRRYKTVQFLEQPGNPGYPEILATPKQERRNWFSWFSNK